MTWAQSTWLRGLCTTLGLGLALAGIAAVLTALIYISPAAAFAVVLAPPAALGVLRRPVWGVYAGLLAVALEVAHIRFGYRALTVGEQILLLTALVALGHMLVAEPVRLAPLHRGFLALVAIAAAGLLIAEDTSSIVRFIRVATLLLVLSVYVSRLSAAEQERVLICLVVSGALCGLGALLTTGPQEVLQGGEVISGRAEAGFAQPNVLGFYLVLCLAPALVLLTDTSAWRRVFVGACAASIVLGLALTLSRSSILGALVTVLVLLRSPAFRRELAMVLVLLVAIAAANWSAVARSPTVGVLSTRLSTLQTRSDRQQDSRLQIWSTTPSIVLQKPLLGWGEGNFRVAAERFNLLDPSDLAPFDHAHNVPLTIVAELGIIGLAVFVAFIAAIVAALSRALRHDGLEGRLALAVTASLSGLAVCSMLDYPARTYTVLAAILILLGVAAGLARTAPSRA